MTHTLRELITLEKFELRLVAAVDRPAIDAPLTWVHSSDLVDPTPWLLPGQLLLTDGAQFTPDATPEAAGEYVSRLRRREVAGLGFSVDVVHARIPDAVVHACDEQGLPLVEVSGRTPFMSVIRHVADAIAAERSARLSWSLDAQRAIARAALRADGFGEILRVLARRLDCGVALYDSAGVRVHVRGLPGFDADTDRVVAADVARLLERGAPAALRATEPTRATLQTIGQKGRLRGVLAVGTTLARSSAEGDLVESVIALASISLEQQRALAAARRRLRTGVLELVRSGAMDVAARTASAVWGDLPRPPFAVAIIAGPIHGQSVLDELDDLAPGGGDLFYGELDDDVVLLGSPDQLARLATLQARHDLAVGRSSATSWAGFARAAEEARLAAQRATRGGPAATFDELSADGVLGLVRNDAGRSVAARVLAPLRALPADEQDRLTDAAVTWLRANCAWDPAARALGVHRHTLRARIDHLGSVLGLDLEEFAGRAELWAALEVDEVSSRGSRG